MALFDLLLFFVLHENQELRRRHGLSHNILPRVKIGCGHLTYSAGAGHMISEVRELFERVIAERVPIVGSEERCHS